MRTSLRPVCKHFILLLQFFLLVSMTSIPSHSLAESRIPTELQQWIPWVLYDQEEKLCSIDTTESSRRYCTWPSEIELNVREDGATFSQKWLIETRSLVLLPGNTPFWPFNVQSGEKKLLVSTDRGRPAIWLDPGAHTITGSFAWNSLPENLLVPAETGLVHLTLLGKKVTRLQLDQQGRLWFKHTKETQKNSEESLTLQVFRKITDGVPLTQQLHIQLIVSGNPRQETLGLKTGNPFIPLLLNSPLPVRIDSSGRLQIQVRPGQWQIQLTLRNSEPLSPATLTMGDIDGTWPTEEIWVFEADPKLRQIEINTLSPLDPSRTSLPEKWRNFPAYLITAEGVMTLTQKNRGNPNPVPNRLKIHRKIWLDEQGSGLTAYDALSGTMTRDWRLNVNPSLILGKVEVEGSSRLITQLKDSDRTGVEVRQGSLELYAESRIQKNVSQGCLEIPALGWDHTFQQLSMELNLPPGWKLLTTTGVDRVSTWLNRWTLLDIFMVLIIGLATSRILGLGWGGIAILLLFFSFHQQGSPRYLWLPLLGLLAMQQVITATTGKRLCRMAGLVILIVIIVSSVPYMINQIRVGIYPQLEYGDHFRITNEYQTDSEHLPLASPTMEHDASLTESAALPQPRSKTVRKQAYYSLGTSQVPEKPKSIQIDPQDMIQTGPGLPDWKWQQIYLSWNGPVSPEQNISFFFLTPFSNTVLAFVRVFLLTLLIGGFLRKFLISSGRTGVSKQTKTLGASLVFLIAIVFSPQHASAEVPPPEILQELQERLLRAPECGDQCATISNCIIRTEENLLTVELQVDSLIRGAITLPGENRFFPRITLDGQPAQIVRLDSQGYSLIRVEQGSHTILLQKQLNSQDKASFSFPVLPRQGQALLNDWSINGLHEDGRLDKQISLSRITPAAREDNAGTDDADTIQIPAFVRIERTLHMGLKWTVSTRIIRLSPDTVIALDIPLLPGEHVTSAGLQLRKQHARINMGSKQKSFTFHSSMDPVDSIRLTAPLTSSWTEIWFLDVSPIWHVETQGLPEINQTNPAGKRYPEYHPYPGESLQLAISRPKGVTGPTMTVNRSKVVVKPGLRATETTLFVSLNASRGLQHSITLPPDIDLQKTLINGKEFPLQLNNGQLSFPIQPGPQNLEIGWRSKQGVGTRLTTETIDLGIKSVNASIEMTVPSSRWILLTGGPRVGPAVLFWGELLVIILIALLLGRVKLTPLNTLQWLLLSLGLSQVPAPIAAVVVAWLLLLGLRRKKGHEITQTATFNIMQVVLVLLTFAALGALFFAIEQGLLGHPDMQIGGNGSNGHSLHWYQDRADFLLPSAWVITVPLLTYRISMLLWALWLAIALLRWLRWGWDCFSETSTWKKAPPKPKKKPIVRKRRVVTPSGKTAVKRNETTEVTPVNKE
ncbi:hypothetical protein UWK_02328 [Desulfocapsa sulfexigens DSM 10523]|uniref:Uncharacterized protein n=1 Tax=Desulfocapsa sulfexigens (strain DSM 10523 / SB164P1) TaxID=1167006 RepID=M1P5W1_DESSD|nr:hypothetical protein [Desulfocapsa sulfexigens]AGF78868.1 hypothetical protein UWK_02328 [Desulfocapsa sulfexigens DSM 10523]